MDSLFNQDISYDEYEVICVNDGSPDECNKILMDYSSKYNNMTVINQDNSGVSVARNTGIKAAKGKYIWFVDPDDIVVPNCLSLFKMKLSRNSVDMVTFRVYTFDEVFTEKESVLAVTHNLRCNNCAIGIFARLIKRRVIVSNNIEFNSLMIVAEDRVFIAQIEEHVLTAEHIESVFYCYRQRSSSITHKNSGSIRERKLCSHIMAADQLYSIYKNQDDKKQSTADETMNLIWISLLDIASYRNNVSDYYLEKMKQKELFPIKRLPESIYKTAFVTNRTDFIGIFFDFLTTHSNSRIGFYMLKLWCFLYDVIKKKNVGE